MMPHDHSCPVCGVLVLEGCIEPDSREPVGCESCEGEVAEERRLENRRRFEVAEMNWRERREWTRRQRMGGRRA